jgi:hypothetical protein
MNNFKGRIIEIEGSLIINKINLLNTPVEILSNKIKRTANERLKSDLAIYHADQLVQKYCHEGQIEESSFHASLAYEYGTKLTPTRYNNLGYYFLINNDYEKQENYC